MGSLPSMAGGAAAGAQASACGVADARGVAGAPSGGRAGAGVPLCWLRRACVQARERSRWVGGDSDLRGGAVASALLQAPQPGQIGRGKRSVRGELGEVGWARQEERETPVSEEELQFLSF